MDRSDLLVMLSIDGLAASLIADPDPELPALAGLMARGARARSVAPVFPSVTWPCHTSIVTGVTPAAHGVLGNVVFDRARGVPVEHFGDRTDLPVVAETLWDRLHARGERVASLCWPKTRGVAAIPDNIPECYEQALFERHASPPLWAELRERGLPVDRYGPWSAAHALGPLQDWLTVEAARHLLTVRPPRLLLLHLLTLDSFQHDYGPGSPEARWALLEMDALLGRLSRMVEDLGRAESTTWMVFGDHGFADVRMTHHLNQILRQEGLLDLDGQGAVTRRRAWVADHGGAAYVYVLDGSPRTTGERLAERFASLPGVSVLAPDRLASLGLPPPGAAAPTQGDLVLAAEAGVYLTGHASAEAAAAAPVYRGAHGHLPEAPGLGAGLVMAGPGVREGAVLGEVSMLALAPTAARLLGVELPGAQARPLVDALASPLDRS